MEKITTISINPETKNRLESFGLKGETFDYLVNKLLDEIEYSRVVLSKIKISNGNEG